MTFTRGSRKSAKAGSSSDTTIPTSSQESSGRSMKDSQDESSSKIPYGDKLFPKAWVIGSDDTQYDLLCWSIAALRRVSSLPIFVGDFGLTVTQYAEVRESFADVILLARGPDRHPAWFRKPETIVAALTLADQVVWLDTDLEILGPIDDLFDEIEPGKMCLTVDDWANDQVSMTVWNSGVVAIMNPAPELMLIWTEACQHPLMRGDQEILAALAARRKMESQIKNLDRKWNYQRLAESMGVPRPDDLRMIHHTGPIGKQLIRASKLPACA